jgi:hypothetical protein
MNEEDDTLVDLVNLGLYPKQSYDLSLEDRRLRMSYLSLSSSCPFILPHVHAWSLSLGPRRFLSGVSVAVARNG